MPFKKFKTLFDSSSNGRLLIYDGQIIECNAKAPEILQIPRDSLYGHSFAKVLSTTQAYDEFAEENLSQKIALALEGKPQLLSWFFLSKDQQTINIEISIHKISVDNKDYIEARLVDNTQRYQIQQAINYIASEAANDTGNSFFENLLKKLTELFKIEFAFIGIYNDMSCTSIETLVACAQGKITDNLTFDLKGTPATDILRNGICIYPKDVQSIFSNNQLLTSMRIESLIGLSLFDSKGEPIGILAILDTKPMPNAEHLQEIMQIYALRIANEIERLNSNKKLKIAKDIAEQAYQAKTEFLSNMSHELRTPLHAIINYSEFGLKKKNLSPEKLLKYFSAINKSGSRLLHLVNNLLDLGKMESGKLELSLSNEDITTIFNASITELQFSIEAKQIEIDLQTSLSTNSLLCDKILIHQLLINILSNAIKFSPEQKPIIVKIQDNTSKGNLKDAIYISISDCGVGIPENENDVIFNEFIQSSTTKSGAGGTGLGLSISKNIVHTHGGEIWATNRLKESGSTFHIILPRNISTLPNN